MACIVLVHGAWGGSYGFRQVRQLLSATGHEVFTPSLTGIGERSHLTGEHVDLSLHTSDVLNTIFYEDLDDITLLGFSYGGMVVTNALDEIGDKVRHLVYLDAFVPEDGESATSILGEAGAGMIAAAEGGLVTPLPRELETPEATAWSEARRAKQPVRTLTESVSLATPVTEWDFSRTYIKATADPNEPRDSAFWRFADRAAASASWQYYEVATNHMVPMTKPQELADIISSVVG